MDVSAFIVGAFGVSCVLAGLGAWSWGLLLVALKPDGKCRGDGAISIGGGTAAVIAGLGALAWVSV